MIENQEENQQASFNVTDPAWIGLSRDPWTYSARIRSPFRQWWSYEPNNQGGKQFCATLFKNGFSDMECDARFPFVCSGKANH